MNVFRIFTFVLIKNVGNQLFQIFDYIDQNGQWKHIFVALNLN